MLVIDSSNSMNETINDTSTTRKDLVLNSAQKLVENLLTLNSST